MTTYVSQGSAATDLRGGGSFNSTFLYRSFLNLTLKMIFLNRSTVSEVIITMKVAHVLRHGVVSQFTVLQIVDPPKGASLYRANIRNGRLLKVDHTRPQPQQEYRFLFTVPYVHLLRLI